MKRQRTELGVAYGLIAGGAIGSLLMALTGDLLWVVIGPPLGLLFGLVGVSLLQRRHRHGASGPE